MPYDVRVLRILIASPSDVKEERDAADEIIKDWNGINSETTGIMLQSRRWETDVTPDLSSDGQSIVNVQIVDSCDALIGIFWNKLGSRTKRAPSGTAEEIERCREAGKRCMIYFSDKEISPSMLDIEQRNALLAYKKEIQDMGLYASFKSVEEFREQLRKALPSLVQQYIAEQKREQNAERLAEVAVEAAESSSSSNSGEQKIENLSTARLIVKNILASRFATVDLQDLIDEQILAVAQLSNSPFLAAILSQPGDLESVRAVVNAYEEVMRPSIYLAYVLGQYNAEETGRAVVDWLESLASQPIQSGYTWANMIRRYPALLFLYALGLGQLQSGNTNLIKQALDIRVSPSFRGRDEHLLEHIHPSQIFVDNLRHGVSPLATGERFTPVSDHLDEFFSDLALNLGRPEITKRSFDLLEFLLSFVAASLDGWPAFGTFGWRTENHRYIINLFQSAVAGESGFPGQVRELLGGIESIKKTSTKYDKVSNDARGSFGRFLPLPITSRLITLTNQGKRVNNMAEAMSQ